MNGVRINRAHPAAAGLSAAFAFSEGVGAPRNLVADNTEYKETSSGVWDGSGYNLYDTATQALRVRVATTTNRSMLAGFWFPSSVQATAEQYVGVTGAASWAPGDFIGLRVISGRLEAYDYAGEVNTVTLVPTPDVNTPYVSGQVTSWSGTSGGSLRAYLNGRSVGTSPMSIEAPYTGWNTYPAFHIGYQRGTLYNFACFVAYYWDRAIAPEAMQSLTSEPFQLLTR